MNIIEIIEKETKRDAIIKFLPIQLGDVEETFSNINKSTKMLDFLPKVSINEGIPKFIKWYKSYYK
jgi:UDP-glucuronate 4-epimerase